MLGSQIDIMLENLGTLGVSREGRTFVDSNHRSVDGPG